MTLLDYFANISPMVYAKLAVGVLFLLLGWVYLYKPNLVSRINSFARDVFFNDRVILLARKKVSIVFFCLSFVAIFMGLSSTGGWVENAGTALIMNNDSYRLYRAIQNYHAGRYEETIQTCEEILTSDPKNKLAIHQLAQAYMAMNNTIKRRAPQGKK